MRILALDWPTYFVLGPVIIGVGLLFGRKIYYDFAVDIGRIKPVSLSGEAIVRLLYTFLVLKVFFDFLPMAKRLYPTERSLSVEDLLPIDFTTRYYVFYLEQLLRDLPFFIFGLVLLLFFGKTDLLGWPFTIWVFFPAVEIGFTLTWIHFWSPNRKQLAGVFCVLVLFLLILPIEQFSWWADFFTFLLAPLGYYRGFKVWRYRDMGHVEQFLLRHQNRKNQTTSVKWLQALCRLVPKGVRPLVQRDLILTARNFVPHVWRNLILTLVVVLSTASRGETSPAIYCALAVFVMSSTVSPLFMLQRPFRQMDVPLPLSSETIWFSKLSYSILLSFPIPSIIWGIEMALRPIPLEASLSLLCRLFLVGIAVASLVGGSICEGDQRPVLQYIVAAFLSLLATLFIALFNPFMFLLLFPVLSNLKGSAMIRLENEGVTSLCDSP